MTGKSRLFNREWQAWVAVALYTVLLYSTLSVVYDLYLAVFRQLGRETMSLLINLVFLAAGILLLGLVLKLSTFRWGALVAFVLIAATTAFCVLQLEVPAKRIHFFQYGPLTLLLLEAVSFRCSDRYRYIWTLVLVMLIGLGDETIQGILPQRTFGLTDVMVNTLAGLLTLGFVAFVIGEREPA